MSQIGSGALPLETLESAGLAMTPAKGSSGRALDALAALVESGFNVLHPPWRFQVQHQHREVGRADAADSARLAQVRGANRSQFLAGFDA